MSFSYSPGAVCGQRLRHATFRCRAELSVRRSAFRGSRVASWRRWSVVLRCRKQLRCRASRRPVASWNGPIQSNAPRCAVVEQLAYIQSIPFSPNKGIRDCVNSSTVSLKASEGSCPCSRNVSYCANRSPWMAPISVPRSPVRSE